MFRGNLLEERKVMENVLSMNKKSRHYIKFYMSFMMIFRVIGGKTMRANFLSIF